MASSSSSSTATTGTDNKKSSSVSAETPQQMFKRWAMSAIAAVIAESCTFPIDFTKTRLQLQNELGKTAATAAVNSTPSPTTSSPPPTLGMVKMFRHIYTTEGLPAMYMGLGAAALRQAVYGGLGVGLYAPVRKLIIGDTDPKDAPVW